MVFAGLLSLPLLLIKPLISPNLKEIFHTEQDFFIFFAQRAVIGFSFGALASAVYESFFHMKITKKKHTERYKLLFLLLGILVSLVSYFFGLSLAISLILGLAINIAIVIAIRFDLIWDLIFSGFFMGLLYLLIYLVIFRMVPSNATNLWFSENTLGITFLGLPVEELVTVILFGSLWGPIYVAIKGYKEKRS